jgi:acyl carrier protein phosphodiesterase
MNFLAHCLIPALALQDTHPDLTAGGFFGDFIKGPLDDRLPTDLAAGVRLHRRIDAASNQLPALRASCARFPATLRRFAPIFVDIVADHLLCRDWDRFHHEPLPRFSAAAYAAIERHAQHLPAAGLHFLRQARQHDLFARYGETETLRRTFDALAVRLRHRVSGPEVAGIVAANLAGLAADFEHYFPALVLDARQWLDEQGYG